MSVRLLSNRLATVLRFLMNVGWLICMLKGVADTSRTTLFLVEGIPDVSGER